MTTPSGQNPSGENNSLKDGIFTLLIFIGVALVIRGSVIEPFKIPSSSMEPTLLVGDHIFIIKPTMGFRFDIPWTSYFIHSFMQWSLPSRGDIVVFTRPPDISSPQEDIGQNIIKRVIGLPGDTVEVNGTEVFVNGAKLDEPYAVWRRSGVTDFPKRQVPPGKVLLLGDNRDASRDSRLWDDPFLDVTRIKGRAFMIFYNSSDWSFDWSRFFKILH